MHPIEPRIEYYSNFLNDNDFETYQPFCYEHNTGQKKDAYKNLVRALWITRRFEGLETKRHSKLSLWQQEAYDRMINL